MKARIMRERKKDEIIPAKMSQFVFTMHDTLDLFLAREEVKKILQNDYKRQGNGCDEIFKCMY